MHEERLLHGRNRIRDVWIGPDGFVYLLTDSTDGKLLRLEPMPDNVQPVTEPPGEHEEPVTASADS